MASRRKPAAKAARSRVKAKASKRPLAKSRPKEVPSPLESCACVTDLEAIARERLPKGVYDYYAGGAEDEQTVEGNREAFRRVFLRPRARSQL